MLVLVLRWSGVVRLSELKAASLCILHARMVGYTSSSHFSFFGSVNWYHCDFLSAALHCIPFSFLYRACALLACMGDVLSFTIFLSN